MNHKRKRRTVKRVRCQFCKRTGHRGRSHENDPHPGYPRSPRERSVLAEPVPRIPDAQDSYDEERHAMHYS